MIDAALPGNPHERAQMGGGYAPTVRRGYGLRTARRGLRLQRFAGALQAHVTPHLQLGPQVQGWQVQVLLEQGWVISSLRIARSFGQLSKYRATGLAEMS
ncbi:MAG: hypothetical protein ACTHK5_03715 [Tsuneonella sp.]